MPETSSVSETEIHYKLYNLYHIIICNLIYIILSNHRPTAALYLAPYSYSVYSNYEEGARDVNNIWISDIITIYNYSGVSTMSEIRRRFRVHDEQDTDHKERDKVIWPWFWVMNGKHDRLPSIEKNQSPQDSLAKDVEYIAKMALNSAKEWIWKMSLRLHWNLKTFHFQFLAGNAS